METLLYRAAPRICSRVREGREEVGGEERRMFGKQSQTASDKIEGERFLEMWHQV